MSSLAAFLAGIGLMGYLHWITRRAERQRIYRELYLPEPLAASNSWPGLVLGWLVGLLRRLRR